MKEKEKIKKYLPETAGFLMKTNIPTINEDLKVGDIEKMLLEKSKQFETIDYVYVLDKFQKLKGVISIKELYGIEKTALVRNHFIKNPVSSRPSADQEKVALLAVRHNIKAIPVVDKKNKFLGVVVSDDILNILHSESVEDALRFAGSRKFSSNRGIVEAGVLVHFKKRFPWLFLGLLGGILAAMVVGFFEGELAKNIALASFIPAIVYMADAVGSQTQTIFIRSLALAHKLDLKKYIWREVRVNFILAILLGGVVFGVGNFWAGSMILASILGFSITLTIMMAMVVAIFLPWMLEKFKYDPAIASGPFATVVRDILSLLIYFSVAGFFL